MRLSRSLCYLLCLLIVSSCSLNAQPNLVLNGGFEDVNVCTEYAAECGVEGWFYLKDVKAQMIADYDSTLPLGANSFGIFYKWIGYTGFTPVIGTILPCFLQKGNEYRFSALVQAKLNGRLDYAPGIVLGEKFYVPNRPFSTGMAPHKIEKITQVPGKEFYQLEYTFTATGNERYLTFGSFVHEDSTAGKRQFIGGQSISLILDNFQLVPLSADETYCNNYELVKARIYRYDYRHKEMDYSLFAKGELNITHPVNDSDAVTQKEPPPAPPIRDTLRLGDVLFDFNRARLKPAALEVLESFFEGNKIAADSIYLEGHTDSVGTDRHNYELSVRRCESVEAWLLSNRVVSKERMQIHPFGKTRPIASNETAEGRAQNRRVELIVFSSDRKKHAPEE